MQKTFLLLLPLLLLFSGCGKDKTKTQQPETEEGFNPYNEPYFQYQWYLAYTDNDFSRSALISQNAHIHILDAWKYTRGEGVTVAVIDDSYEVGHRDLSTNITDFYNADFQNTKVENDTDDSSHGTATAGFIAAPKNDYGIVGTAPDAKLVLIAQIYDDDVATIRAFEYAKNKGAKIISNSWGTGNVSPAVAEELALLKEQNITILFASGNYGPSLFSDNQDLDVPGVTDESELPSVIGVGATNEQNQLASYSNYGKNIDILAPGGEYLGLLGLDDTGVKGVPYNTYTFTNGYSITIDNAHAFETGTSFSCPLAAGVAALMLSVNPSLTPDQIRTILIESAEKIEANSVYYDDNGFNLKRAYGKINAAKAVELAKNYQPQQ